MKNLLVFIFMQFFCLGHLLIGQMNHESIKKLSHAESNKISSVLSLNFFEAEKIASIYIDYYSSLSNAINSSKQYLQIIDDAEKKKNVQLSKVLGASKYKSFLLFESIYTNESIEYYKTLYASLEETEILEKEIANYYRLNIFPVISKLRIEFDSDLRESDQRTITSLKDTIYSYLTIQSDSVINNTNSSHRKIYYQLLSIGDKYSQEYDKILEKAEPFVSIWKGEIKKILSDYYTAQQVQNFANQDIELVKLGLLESINKLSFLILEPYYILKFYKNLSLIQNIKDSALEIRLKK